MKNRFLFFVLFMVTIAGLQSCGSAYRLRKTEKENHKLYVAATTNEVVSTMVASDYNLKHPIAQKITYIKGKDSLRIDSIPYDVFRDSIIKVECPSVNFDSLKRAWTKVIYHNSVDTIVYPDTTCWRKVDIIQSQYNVLQGKYVQQTVQAASLSKTQKKTSLWLIIVSVGAFLIISGLTYLLFKK